ncbi:MAG: hypothetical protein NE328_10930 [Lentisphaeraceae bacterium]|nr:hypothetical protein [Lentisphaeraceae bacterium]
MFKLFISVFILFAGFSHSQEIPKEELDKLPPEIREKLLEALKDVKGKVKEVNIDDEFTDEDLQKFEEKHKREKEEARKKIITVNLPSETKVEPIDKAKALEAIKQLGANHYKIRKNAKTELTTMGYQVIPLLEEALKSSHDPEVSENLKEIILKLSHRLHINQLNKEQKALASLPFSYGSIEGQKVKAEFYNTNGHFVIDIGQSRIAIPGEIKALSGSSRRNVNISLSPSGGGSGSSSSNDFTIYEYTNENGTGFWNICGHSFTVSSYTVNIRNKKLNLQPKVPQVLFFDKEGKSLGILDLK